MLGRYFVLLLLLYQISAGAQTKISVPPAKVSLEELAQKNPKKRKELRRKDLFKKKHVNAIKKQLRKNTDLDKHEIYKYSVMIRKLDSTKLEGFHSQLEEVIERQDLEKLEDKRLNKVNRAIKTGKNARTYQKTFEQRREFLYDSLSYDSLTLPGLAFDSMDSLDIQNDFTRRYTDFVDDTVSVGTLLHRPTLDSAYGDETQVEAFLESFAKRQVANQDFLLPVDKDDPITQMKNFIPELETFNYQKPEIPKEKLSKALIDQKKERKKEELKRSVLSPLKKYGEKPEKIRWVDRWKIGGFVEYEPTTRLIEVTPTLTYGLSEKFMVGAGYSMVIPVSKNNQIEKQRAYRAFLDYVFYRSFFLHLESEWIEQKFVEKDAEKERNTYLGLGRTFTYKKLSTNILWLYNLSNTSNIEASRFSVRFAVNFNP